MKLLIFIVFVLFIGFNYSYAESEPREFHTFKTLDFPPMDKSPNELIDMYKTAPDRLSEYIYNEPEYIEKSEFREEFNKIYSNLHRITYYLEYTDKDSEDIFEEFAPEWLKEEDFTTPLEMVIPYKSTHIPNFPSNDKSPQHYLDRYDSDAKYRKWYDKEFPYITIHNILGYENPSIEEPLWIKQVLIWWTDDLIDDGTFLSVMNYWVELNK